MSKPVPILQLLTVPLFLWSLKLPLVTPFPYDLPSSLELPVDNCRFPMRWLPSRPIAIDNALLPVLPQSVLLACLPQGSQ